jgi:hypothetical protein
VNTTTRVLLCANGRSVRASTKNEAVLREWLANTPARVAAGNGRRELTLLIRPGACARCRSAYWQSMPVSSRANSPSDAKWRVESQSVARRKQERHLARLRELAAEFGFALPPVGGHLSVATPVFPLPQELCQPGGVPEEQRSQFNEPVPSRQSSVPAPRRSLAEEWHRRMAADPKIMPPK